MKTKTKIIAAMLALGASALIIVAQDSGGSSGGQPGGPGGPGGPNRRGMRPPLPAVVRALDANHDGIVDADEIANAPAALKTLDKDGDGKLTIQELMGPRPQGMGRPPGGPNSGNEPPPGPPPGDQ
jgi:hypothetical protein